MAKARDSRIALLDDLRLCAAPLHLGLHLDTDVPSLFAVFDLRQQVINLILQGLLLLFMLLVGGLQVANFLSEPSDIRLQASNHLLQVIDLLL